ncbi:MAG: PRC-barrel domain-containing protein [Proteobacteria bacterium]|nr:PRC-barrel domain-containing protein [Pseudomonadota bacterium]
MMRKHALMAAALAAVLATPAFAQSTTAPAPSAAPSATTHTDKTAATPATGSANFVQSQQSTDWRGSKLIGASVYGPDNASIGEINDLIVGTDGKISAVVVGVGGFLGVGQKDVALPFENISVTRKADSASIDKIKVSYTKDQLKSAPKFAYYEPASKSTTTGSGAASGGMGGSAGGMKPATTTPPANGTAK